MAAETPAPKFRLDPEDLDAIIAGVVERMTARHDTPNANNTNAGGNTPIAPPARVAAHTAYGDHDNRLRDSDIGYFFPDMPDSYGEGESATIGHDRCYRDVNAFVDSVRQMASYRGEDQVRNRLPSLLRGNAHRWFTNSLDPLSKEGLRYGRLALWIDALERQFAQPADEALLKLQSLKYTLNDAAEGRPIADYIFECQRLARNAGFPNHFQQFTWIFRGIAPMLSQGVPRPEPGANLASVVRGLEDRREDWRSLAKEWLSVKRGSQADRQGGRSRHQFDDSTSDARQRDCDRTSRREFKREDPRDARYSKGAYGSSSKGRDRGKPMDAFGSRPTPKAVHVVERDTSSDDEDPPTDDDDSAGVDIHHCAMTRKCNDCGEAFGSRNRLFQHLENNHQVTRQG